MPEIDSTIQIEIKSDDLERQTFRSGGPGGQHQNKTESGVRYIHLPTGIAAESRTERSQHKNDANALALLKARLYRVEELKQQAEVEKLYDEKGEVAWGYQIRNYVMQPYTLVKDVRTAWRRRRCSRCSTAKSMHLCRRFCERRRTRRGKKENSRRFLWLGGLGV